MNEFESLLNQAAQRMTYASKEAENASLSFMRRTLDEVMGLSYSGILEKISFYASEMRQVLDGIPAEYVILLCRQTFAQKIKLPESISSSSGAILEIIGLVALSRGSENIKPPSEIDIRSAIDKAMGLASSILTLGNILTLERNKGVPAEFDAHKVKGRIESETLGIRGKQYIVIEEYLYEQIFSNPKVANIFFETMNFSYHDFKIVRDAIVELRIEDFQRLEDLVKSFSDRNVQFREELKPKELLINPLRISPGRIADKTLIPSSIVNLILEHFSVDFQTLIPSVAVHQYLKNISPPLFGKLLRIEDEYLELTPSRLGQDTFRDSFEDLLLESDEEQFESYSRARGEITERIASEAISRIFKKSPLLSNFKFTSKESNGEVDLLFEDNARYLIVEVKAGDIERTTNLGKLHLMKRALRETLQGGSRQASKFANFLRSNEIRETPYGKIDWAPDSQSLKIVVSLDNLGTIGTTYRRYLENHVDIDSDVWFLSLHDLLIISVVDISVNDFIAYVGFRTTNPVGRQLEAMEELDIWLKWQQSRESFKPGAFVSTFTDKLDMVFESLTEFPCTPIASSRLY